MNQNDGTQPQATPEAEVNTDRIDHLIRAGLQQIQDREIRQNRVALAEIGIGI